MTGDVLLGIDLGTTVLKAAAFDARSGEALGVAAVRLPLRTDADGTREQDPKALDRALRKAAGELSRKLGKAWSSVAGVGLAAQGGSAIIADRSPGRPHTPMPLWSDTRPLHLLGDIAKRKPDGYWRRLSYLDDPGAGLARMQWLRARRPGLFSNDNIYVGAGEYIFFKLTGTWRQDAGSALQIGCYNARSHRLASGPLKLIDIPASFVAPMRCVTKRARYRAAAPRCWACAKAFPPPALTSTTKRATSRRSAGRRGRCRSRSARRGSAISSTRPAHPSTASTLYFRRPWAPARLSCA